MKKKNRSTKLSIDKHFNCLNEMKTDFINYGKIKSISNYFTKHHISQSTRDSLIQLNVIKRIDYNTYSWDLGKTIDSGLVNQIRDLTKEKIYASNPNLAPRKKQKINEKTVALMNEKIMQEKILNKMVKATKAASTLGINLGDLDDEKMKNFVKHFEG